MEETPTKKVDSDKPQAVLHETVNAISHSDNNYNDDSSGSGQWFYYYEHRSKVPFIERDHRRQCSDLSDEMYERDWYQNAELTPIEVMRRKKSAKEEITALTRACLHEVKSPDLERLGILMKIESSVKRNHVLIEQSYKRIKEENDFLHSQLGFGSVVNIPLDDEMLKRKKPPTLEEYNLLRTEVNDLQNYTIMVEKSIERFHIENIELQKEIDRKKTEQGQTNNSTDFPRSKRNKRD